MNKLFLEGTNNTRDLGGYITQDNRVVKSGILFRSDKLQNITQNDIQYLKKLGIKRIIDFRSENEKKKQPNIIPEEMTYVELPIQADKKIQDEIDDVLNGKINKDIKDFLIEANKQFINEYKDKFRLFLLDIIRNQVPTLFHCTAGKDRTGFATLLIYTILGIDRETIIQDYLKTNYFIADTLDKVKNEVAKNMNIPENEKNKLLPLLQVDEDYLNSAINEANKKYGSIFNFISDGLNISLSERDQIKELMLSKI